MQVNTVEEDLHDEAVRTSSNLSASYVGDESRSNNWRRIFAFIIFALVTAGLMLFEFGGALGSFFTSDDLIHVTYASKMFADNAELFFRTFTTVWMQDNSTEVFYRPLIEVSFAIDQWFSGANPLGYHISNFLYAFVGAIALFFITRSLTRRFEVGGGDLIAYGAALTFAVNPLHTEVVSWLIGRVDGLSTMFYLLSFALFLQIPIGKNAVKSWPGWLSLAAFALALLSKEMSASLPLVVFACSLFLCKEEKLTGKLRQSFRFAAPYFALLGVYFVIRYLATGQLLGGYVGAVGEANVFSISSVIDRFAHFWKVAYPFNEELIERNGDFENAFRAFYIFFGVYLLARLRSGGFSGGRLKLVGFLVTWLVLQFLPLYQVFMIHNTLAGSRLFYMSTAVLSVIAAVLIVPDFKNVSNNARRLATAAAAILFMASIGLSVFVGKQNNQCWIEAARHVEDMQIELNNAVAVLPPEKKLLLAYSPIQVLGAHMFNRYYLIQSLFSPPLLRPDISNRIAVLEPRFYTYDHLIPGGALRKKLADTDRFATVYWNVDRRKLIAVRSGKQFAFPSGNTVLPALKIRPGDYGMTEIIAEKPFDPSAVRFIDVDIANSQPAVAAKDDVMVLSFDRERVPPKGLDNWVQASYDLSKKRQTVRFAVDQKFVWFLHNDMSKFGIFLRDKPNLSVVSARLNDGKALIPTLAASGQTLKEFNDGAYRPLEFPLKFDFDVSKIPGAVSCYCELSRPRAMFQLEHFTYRDVSPSKKPLKKWTVNGTAGSISLERSLFGEDACYQLRIFAQNADGRLLGVSSDLVDLGINDRPRWQPL